MMFFIQHPLRVTAVVLAVACGCFVWSLSSGALAVPASSGKAGPGLGERATPSAEPQTAAPVDSASPSPVPAPPAADGCYHIYLDFGTNTAVQFHKLYDPGSLPPSDVPGRTIRTKFDQFFGSDAELRRSDVCGFGFEPNPSHRDILRQTTVHYGNKGVRLAIVESGVGTFDGWGVVVSDEAYEQDEWGSKVVPVQPGTPVPADAIRVINAASWFAANVQRSQRPPQGTRALPPAMVIKVDIEGSDESVLAMLVASGALCNVDYVYVEHVRPDVLDLFMLQLRTAGCSTLVEKFDDESFHNFKPAWASPTKAPLRRRYEVYRSQFTKWR